MNNVHFYQNPRWPDFMRRYAQDLRGFARDVCGVELAPNMDQAYATAELPGCRVAMTGALDYLQDDDQAISPLAPVALWHLLCRPGSATNVVLPPGGVRRRRQYRELLKAIASGPYGWLCEVLDVRSDEIRVLGANHWRILFITAGAPQVLLGYMHKDLLWLVEDAHALPDQCFEVMGGARYGHTETRLVMLSHFLAITGFAYRARNSPNWDAFNLEHAHTAQTPA